MSEQVLCEHPMPVFGCEGCMARRSQYVNMDRAERRSLRARQKTADAKAAIERGEHPYTHRPLLGTRTCGECAHFIEHRVGNTYFKCAHPLMPPPTRSDATDIRKTWPACDWFREAVS